LPVPSFFVSPRQETAGVLIDPLDMDSYDASSKSVFGWRGRCVRPAQTS
jgi:hypothetical protein